MASTARCQNVLAWFRKNGGYFNESIRLVEDEEYGVHFRASKVLTPPTAVCACPAPLSISHLNVSGSDAELAARLNVRVVDSVCSKLVGRVPDLVIGYFFLIEQRLLGEESFWHEYVACLPREEDMTTPLFFADEDLKWLLGTNLHSSDTDPRRSSVILRKNDWRGEWRQGYDALREQGVDVSGYTWESFLWAATTYSSRSFTSAYMVPNHRPSFLILFPVLDYANHRFAAKAAWAFTNSGFSLTLEEEVAEDAQVYNNYAPKGNEELLLGYGFTLPDNPCDEVMVRLGRPPDAVINVLHKTFPERFSEPSAWDSSQGTFSLRGSGHFSGGYHHGIACLRGVPIEMFSLITEMAYFMSTGETDGAGDVLGDTDRFAAVLEEFVIPLTHKLAMIEGPMAQLGDKEPGNRKQRIAKTYRDGQVAILREILQELQDHVEKLGLSEEHIG